MARYAGEPNLPGILENNSSPAPPWATHFIIEVNADGLGAGAVFFDDLLATDF